MKELNTLIIDIQDLLKQRDWVTEPISQDFASSVSRRLQEQFSTRAGHPTLRLSRMGPQCPCALWHSIHKPELEEPLPPWAEFKYSFGHIIEAQAIMLAKAAGHEVVGEQDEISVDGIVGHRDCIIDGCLVDVKSSASLSFKKFKDGSLGQNDSFGYLDQLDGYLVGSADDPLLKVKDRAYLLAIDKQLGHMCLYEHRLREENIRKRILSYKQIVAQEKPPQCTCKTVVESNGNITLGFPATYNSFKHACFPNLRTFIYSGGPVYFVKVVKRPTYKGQPLMEIDKFGNKVYN